MSEAKDSPASGTVHQSVVYYITDVVTMDELDPFTVNMVYYQ